MQAAMETTMQVAATIVVRFCEVMGANSEVQSAESFQIPAFEDQHRATQSDGGIKEGVKRVLQDELSPNRLLMGNGADDVESGEIRYDVCGGGGDPAGEAVSQGGESAQVIGEAANHE